MKRAIYIFTLAFLAYGAKAQDIHFSQFYNSPLTLNPALTGVMDGELRAGVIYRNQWRSVTSPFVTTAGYFDMPIHKGLKNGDAVGVGLLLFDDKTGSAGFTTFTGLLSAAYHKTLGVNHTHVLSFGVQLGLSQTRLDPSKAIFADQLDASLNNTLTSSEASNISSRVYEEFNAGIGYSFKFGKGKRDKLYIGGSFYHITQPKESVLSTDSRLPIRENVHAGMEITVAKNLSLLPSFVFLNQAANQEINLGVGVKYAFTPDIKAIVGLYYRVKDAVIPMIGLDIKGVNLGFSYDVTASNLATASSKRSAFELSILYILPYKKQPSDNSVIYSPRF